MDASPPKTHLDATSALRPLRALTAVVVAALSLTIAPNAAAADAHQAHSADSFVDSIGVNTHTSYNDTAYYSQFGVVKQRLAELGVRHLREELVPDRPDQYERLRELAAAGIKSTLILGDPANGLGEIDTLTAILAGELQGTVDAVEGPNEFAARGGSEWQPRLAEYQQQLYDRVKGNPALASLPVIGPSIIHRSEQEAMGDISGKLDYGNVHPYPNGEDPEGNIASSLRNAALNSGASKPVMATETGYHNALGWSGEHDPASEEAAAIYMPRLFLEYFRQGVARTYAYELLDEKPDPGLGERERHFGLLRNDLSPKPAFDALRNTIAILADPGPSFAGASVDYEVGGDRGDLHEVLLQKRDGSFYLALWRDSSVWDAASRTALDPGSKPVTLGFARQVESAERFLPSRSAAPAPVRVGDGGPLTVDVGTQVVILRLELGAPVSGRIKVWVSRHSVAPGGRLAVRGKLPSQAAGRSLRVKIQRWHKGKGWGTVGHSRTSRLGVFRKKIRLPKRTAARASRLRVVARVAKPSKAVRVRIRTRS